eukprot:m.127555 g.127555  ORF g.127555 m.127555 type:complete len:566 (+) comp13601_c0_seq2:3097-4794(+)
MSFLSVVAAWSICSNAHAGLGAYKPSAAVDNYSPEVTPWPEPRTSTNGTLAYAIDPTSLSVSGAGAPTSIVAAAVARVLGQIHNNSVQSPPLASPVSIHGTINHLSLSVANPTAMLTDTTDESYSMTISSEGVSVTAATSFGALRALSSLQQMVEKSPSSVGGWRIRGCPWHITDAPRFSHRGVLLDTSRHYLPLSDLLTFVEAMAFAKLNVLHWHIVDAQAFPFASEATELGRGAWSPEEQYSVADLRTIVAYALARGVRIVPEVDTPGHVKSWSVAYPDIVTPCSPTTPRSSNPPLDPTTNQTYEVVEKLLRELGGIFIDTFFHLGGDEVMYTCWNASTKIRAYMERQGYGDNFAKLQQEYETRLLAVATSALPNRTLIMYQEVFDEGVVVPDSLVVDVWKRANNNTVPKSPALNVEVGVVARAGHRVIVANGPNGEWYLNDGFGNGLCQVGGCLYALWGDVYTNEPLDGTDLSPNLEHMVLGGEASLWGEEIDSSNLMVKAWPRAAAFGERMWSSRAAAGVSKESQVNEAGPRLARVVCKMKALGFAVSPIAPGSCSHWSSN